MGWRLGGDGLSTPGKFGQNIVFVNTVSFNFSQKTQKGIPLPYWHALEDYV